MTATTRKSRRKRIRLIMEREHTARRSVKPGIHRYKLVRNISPKFWLEKKTP